MSVDDTGPPYPPAAAPGSNGIGSFIIGVSQIGSISDFNIWMTIISQYANSPRLVALIMYLFDYLDQTTNFESFFDDIFNIQTAVGYGLDVWGRRVGVSRTLQIQTTADFGFNEALPGSVGFNQGNFYSGEPLTSNFSLSDTAYRQLILVKAAANITDCSIPAINQILLALFPGRGNIYVTDGEDMTMTYTSAFALQPVDLAILQQSGALPKPAGVKLTIVSP